MNRKMTTDSQLSTTEPKITKTKTKQTTRSGMEYNKCTSHGVFSVGRWRRRMGCGKVQGTRSIIGRYKMDGERLRMV